MLRAGLELAYFKLMEAYFFLRIVGFFQLALLKIIRRKPSYSLVLSIKLPTRRPQPFTRLASSGVFDQA